MSSGSLSARREIGDGGTRENASTVDRLYFSLHLYRAGVSDRDTDVAGRTMTARCQTNHRIRLVRARSMWARLRGLLGRVRPLGRRTGLWLSPCWAVHTFGM